MALSNMATFVGPSYGLIRDLRESLELNGLKVRVQHILRGTGGFVRYVCNVPPQAGCREGRQNILVRRKNLIFDFRTESRSFGFDPQELMNAFGAQALTPVCALRFRYYFERPTKLDVKLFFGRDIYRTQRQALHDDYNRSGKGW